MEWMEGCPTYSFSQKYEGMNKELFTHLPYLGYHLKGFTHLSELYL